MNSRPELNLTERQKQAIRDSFESVGQYQASVIVLFYGRLFEIAPEVRPLFKIDIREQSRKLVDTLGLVVSAIEHFEDLRPHLAELGRRHVSYGVQPHQYELLRVALLWAMGQALGLEFSRETRDAWDTLLQVVSAVMLEAANAAVSKA